MAELRRLGLAAGLDAVGVTSAEVLEPARSVLPLRRQAGLAATMQFTYRNPERSTDPARTVTGARSLVVGLLRYGMEQPEPPPTGLVARVARYAHRDYYDDLRKGLAAMADRLDEAGFAARVVADSNALVDRNAAWRAGLGWYAKNTNLLVAGQGSWCVLGAVVTDALLTPAAGPVADGCGSCAACLDGCPTGALVAPGVLDARRCLAWLVQAAEPIPVEHRAAVGDRIYGCDICQEVCPPNKIEARRALSPTVSPPQAPVPVVPAPLAPPAPMADDQEGKGEAEAQPRQDQAWVDVLWILGASDSGILERYGRWYLANRDANVLRRTALVILGNIAHSDDVAVRSLLQRYVNGQSALLRLHAAWAARRLGHHDLVIGLENDPDPAVRAEHGRSVAVRLSG